MSTRVTIKSIARDLGVSHMTVSRALANSPKVREDTRNLIIERARSLGYVKSAAASAMRGDKTAIVGLLLPNLVNEFYARFSNSLAQKCEVNGWQLIIHLTNDEVSKERQAILKLREIQARAVVMVPSPSSLETEATCLQDFQVIQLIRKRDSEHKPIAVLLEDTRSISEAVHHLDSLGHTRIAYIGGKPSLSSGFQRLSAFKRGLHEAGLKLRPEDIFTNTPSFSMGYHTVLSILQSERTTAILCGGFEISNGALNACLEKGVRLPEDLSFVGYGDPSYYRWINGGITTIKIPVDGLADRTAELLKQIGEGKEDTLTTQVLPAEFIIRGSTGPADIRKPLS